MIKINKQCLRLMLSVMVLLTPASMWATNDNTDGVKAEIGDVQKIVDEEFDYKLTETKADLAEVKKAGLVLISTSGQNEKSKTFHVYWKKTMLKDSDTLKEGYLVLVLNSSGRVASFASFFSGVQNLSADDFGDYGVLEIESKDATCDDCEGGLWTQSYIEKVASRLLKGKHFTLSL